MAIVAILPADAVIAAYLTSSRVASALFTLARDIGSLGRAPASCYSALRTLVTNIIIFAPRPQVSSSAFRDITPPVARLFVRRARAAPALNPGPIVAATTLLPAAVIGILIVWPAPSLRTAVIARVRPARV